MVTGSAEEKRNLLRLRWRCVVPYGQGEHPPQPQPHPQPHHSRGKEKQPVWHVLTKTSVVRQEQLVIVEMPSHTHVEHGLHQPQVLHGS